MTDTEGKIMSTNAPRAITWTWQSKENNTRVGRMSMDGQISVAALLAHLDQVAPGIAHEDMQINLATVQWTRTATEAELAERRAAQARHAAAHEKWERETLARLTEKYRGAGHG